MSTSSTSTSTTKSNPEERLSEHAAALRDDLVATKDDAAATASAAVDVAKDQADDVVDLAKAGAEHVDDYHQVLRRNVAKHPTTAVVVSVGVGMLLSRLLTGR